MCWHALGLYALTTTMLRCTSVSSNHLGFTSKLKGQAVWPLHHETHLSRVLQPQLAYHACSAPRAPAFDREPGKATLQSSQACQLANMLA